MYSSKSSEFQTFWLFKKFQQVSGTREVTRYFSYPRPLVAELGFWV